MNMQRVEHRPGQTIQCFECLKMKDQVWGDLDGPAYKAYVCFDCLPNYTGTKQ